MYILALFKSVIVVFVVFISFIFFFVARLLKITIPQFHFYSLFFISFRYIRAFQIFCSRMCLPVSLTNNNFIYAVWSGCFFLILLTFWNLYKRLRHYAIIRKEQVNLWTKKKNSFNWCLSECWKLILVFLFNESNKKPNKSISMEICVKQHDSYWYAMQLFSINCQKCEFAFCCRSLEKYITFSFISKYQNVNLMFDYKKWIEAEQKQCKMYVFMWKFSIIKKMIFFFRFSLALAFICDSNELLLFTNSSHPWSKTIFSWKCNKKTKNLRYFWSVYRD